MKRATMDIDYGPARLRQGIRTRSSSYDRTGGNCDHWKIHPRQEMVLLETDRPGCIRHIWFTIGSEDPLHLRNMVLRAHWDGEATPSVLCPLGDFFGQGHGVYSPFETPWLGASAQGGRALNCFFPMPFAKGARISVENQSDCPTPAHFYFYIDYETGQAPPEDVGRFHAHWRRECLTRPDSDLANRTGDGNFLIADIAGRGQYVGTILYQDSPSPFWNGEGDDMFFIDGESWPPRCHGTGTEDYFNTAWCPRERAIGEHHGVILSGHPHGQPFLGKSTFYRFHTADPVMFGRSLRVSIEHGTGNEFVGDWAATSFWYALGRPAALPDLPPPEQRRPLPPLEVDVGKVLEQPHKCLSYFAQTGAAGAGAGLIDQLESKWRDGQLDLPAAQAWAEKTWSAVAAARREYLRQAGKSVQLPDLSGPAARPAELTIDRIHGSRELAPLSGRVWLGYDADCLHVEGRFDIPAGTSVRCCDKIDLMLCAADWSEKFWRLSVWADRPALQLARHLPNGWLPWDRAAAVTADVPVELGRGEGEWSFKYRVPWELLGITPRPGLELGLNIDRWHFVDGAWWASWAITPHHFYPPQIAGRAILAGG